MRVIATVINDLSYDQRMIRICTTLVEGGHDVLLVGRDLPNSKPLVSRPFQQKRLPSWFQSGKLMYVEYNIRLFFFLLWQRFDVLNAVDLDTILPAIAVAKLKAKKVAYDAHEYFTEVPEVVTRPRIQAIWKAIEKWAVPKVDVAYTVCQSLAHLFEEEYKKPFGIIRNVPFRNVPARIEKSTKIILYQGALNEGRGLSEMITAMKGIENAVLWIVGEGDLSQVLRQQTKDLHLEERVKFLGYVQPEALKEITPQAYIGINLLENKGLSYYYSLANKSFDYIQALVPSINMDFPEYRNISATHEVGVLISDLRPATIQKAIKDLLEDDVLYHRLQANCEVARAVYVWEKEREKLLAIYEKL